MSDLITTKFDSVFKTDIPHLAAYPELLPFVGEKWETSKKILLVGESHYLPYDEIKSYSDFNFKDDWYNGTSLNLKDEHKKYLTTRHNVLLTERSYNHPSLKIYSNLKKAIIETKLIETDNHVFNNFSYYNYFQKPVYVTGMRNENRSMSPNKQDSDIAFQTLKKVTKILNTNTIIFVSKKAFDQFCKSIPSNEVVKSFININIDFVPHAGRQWWNRTSVSYGMRTGKQKFMELLKEAYNTSS